MTRILALILAAMLALAANAALADASPPSAAQSTPTAIGAVTCQEDDPCWTWSRNGNHKRGIVTAWGTPRTVGPCGYRRIWFRTPRRMRPLLGPTLRGDAWARTHGCQR